MKKERIVINPHQKYHMIGDKCYKVDKEKWKKDDTLDEVVLVEVDKKEYDQRIGTLVDSLIEKVDEKGLLKEVITNALRSLPLKEIVKIERRVEKGKPIKSKEGCVMLAVGDYDIPLAE